VWFLDLSTNYHQALFCAPIALRKHQLNAQPCGSSSYDKATDTRSCIELLFEPHSIGGCFVDETSRDKLENKQLKLSQVLVLLLTTATWFATFQFRPHVSIFKSSVIIAVLTTLMSFRPELVGIENTKVRSQYGSVAIGAWFVVYVLSAGPVTKYTPRALEPMMDFLYAPVRYFLLKIPLLGPALRSYLNAWFTNVLA